MPAVEASPLADETARLSRIRAFVRAGDLDAALAALADYRAAHPSGVLGPEADALAARACQRARARGVAPATCGDTDD